MQNPVTIAPRTFPEDSWGRTERAWARVGSEVKLLVEEMKGAFPEDARHRFAQSMQNPSNVLEYERGYEEGKRVGFDEAIGKWLKKWEYLFQVLIDGLRALPGLTVTAGAVLLSPAGTPIPPEVQRRFEAVLWVQELKKLKPLFERFDKASFFETVGLTVSDVVLAMRRAGTEWVAGFYARTGKPKEQGHYAGRLIGGACAAVLTAAIEVVAEKGAGSVLEGTNSARRIEELAKERFSPKRRRVRGLEDIVDEVSEEVLKKGSALSPVVKKQLGEAKELLDHLRRRLGSLLPKELADLPLDDWLEILQLARSFKGKTDKQSVRTLKGYIAERLYRHLPQFNELRAELIRSLKGSVHWREEVVFERNVSALAPGKKQAELPLTDGMLVAYAADDKDPRVLILAVFESKSPSNVRDLVRAPREKGQPPSWGGQFSLDFERLSELPVVINGVQYGPDQVAISRKQTRWLAVVPREVPLTDFAVNDLKKQGFVVDVWNLPIRDTVLNRASEEVLTAVQHEPKQ